MCPRSTRSIACRHASSRPPSAPSTSTRRGSPSARSTGRPFASREALQSALYGALQASSDDEKLALIRAHPELAGKEADAGTLTDASAREQAAAGLGALTPDQKAELAILNARYGDAFGFPFVICARLNRRDAILGTLRARLHNTREQEIANAIAQIGEIARLRVADLVS